MTGFDTLAAAIDSGRLDPSFTTLYGHDNSADQKNRYKGLLHQLKQAIPTGRPFFVSAPGRTELGGNHTDHNRGRILAAAVDLDCAAAVVPVKEPLVTVVSSELDAPVIVDLDRRSPLPEEQGTTAALIRGVAAAFTQGGGTPRGFCAHIHATCLPGIGISSSAAFSVLMGNIFSYLDPGTKCPALRLARMARKAENDYFGKPCGLMDQMASAAGRIIFADFKDPDQPELETITRDFSGSGYQLALIDTGGTHRELTPEYASIPREMKEAARAAGKEVGRDISRDLFMEKLGNIREAAGDRAALRLLHFINENERAGRMADYLRRGSFGPYLAEVAASGQSSCSLLQNCATITTTRHQGVLLAIAVTNLICPDAVCRVHGGGFAGTAQAYVPYDAWAGFVQQMESVFGPGRVHRLRIGRPGVCVLTEQGLEIPQG